MGASDKHVAETLSSPEFIDWYMAEVNLSNPALDGLVIAIDDWAEYYSVSFDWVKVVALRTLRGWETSPSLAERCDWLLGGRSASYPLDLEHVDFTFRFNWAWSPIGNSRSDAEREVTEAFVFALDKHMQRIENDFRNAGWEPVQQQKSEHFDWLVRRLILNQDWDVISKHDPEKRKQPTLREGANKAAERIGIDPNLLKATPNP
ncbi:MAG: hypothetical protein IH881_18870 [Myxococcales bacterium]|nr:hypothetical protein [Myxococcales bacterium]